MGTFILLTLATILIAYILGSVNGAIISSKLLYRKDIREFGSGNAGLTNFYRTFGAPGAVLVIIIDVLKTIVPVYIGGFLFTQYLNVSVLPAVLINYIHSYSFFGQAVAGFAVMLGHCFPLLYKFKGGKGVMALGCIVLVLDWRCGLIAWGIFIALTLIIRYVSLSSVIGSIAYPVSMALFALGNTNGVGLIELCVVVLCVLLLVVRHTPNMKRLFKGEETKISFGKKAKVMPETEAKPEAESESNKGKE